MISPLKIPLLMSANFGELRPNHFHSGIDLKTQGRIGLPVYAMDDGYVSRVVVSPWGFGRAVYISHSSGLTTAVSYTHLRAHETGRNLVCRLLLEKKKKKKQTGRKSDRKNHTNTMIE